MFITLSEIRWCLAVALPASADLIKAKKRKRKKGGRLEKGSWCKCHLFFLSNLDVGGSLVEALCKLNLVFCPSEFFTSLVLSLLACSDDEREAAGLLFSAQCFVLMILHRLDKSDAAASPRFTTKKSLSSTILSLVSLFPGCIESTSCFVLFNLIVISILFPAAETK